MSLARDTGHRGSIPGRSRPFRDGWQAYLHCLLSRKRDICTVDKLRDARQYNVLYMPEGAGYSNTFLVCMQREFICSCCLSLYQFDTIPFTSVADISDSTGVDQ